MIIPRWGPKPIQIIFGGTGGLMSYFLGIASHLQKTYPRVQNKDPVYTGISGGSISSLLLALNYPINHFHEKYVLESWKELNKHFTGAIGNFYPKVIPKMNDFLEKNQIQTSSLEGKYYLKASRLKVEGLNWRFEPVLLDQWNSSDDLLHAIQSTANLPILGCGLKDLGIKKEVLYDGALTGSRFDLADLGHLKQNQIPSNLKTIYIHTHIVNKYPWWNYWLWTCDEWHQQLFQRGIDDAQKVEEFKFLK